MSYSMHSPNFMVSRFREIGFARCFYAVFLMLTLLCIVFVAPLISFPCKTSTDLLNPFYMVIAALCGIGSIALLSTISRFPIAEKLRDERAFRLAIAIGFIVLLIAQAAIVNLAWFTTGWDVGILTDTNDPAAHSSYYTHYPNQLFLAGLFNHITNLGAMAGFDDGYSCLVAGSCLSVSTSICLAAFVGKKLGGYGAGYAVFAVGTIFIGFSPWILVPYSDTYAMLWTTLSLWFFVCPKNLYVKSSGLCFCALVGYAVKANCDFYPRSRCVRSGSTHLERAFSQTPRYAAKQRPQSHFKKDDRLFGLRIIGDVGGFRNHQCSQA